MKSRWVHACDGVVLLAVLLCAPTLAQDAESPATIPVQGEEQSEQPEAEDANVLDTIIVTAGKRAQDIREFAGSVSALSGESLEKMGAQSMKDYLKMVPGVTLNQSPYPEYSAPIVRGIATDTLPGVGAKTVGIFVDEVPMSNLFRISTVVDLYPFDLERVEVLKGPQGTLFGSSSIAGALRYITNKPALNVWQAKAMGNQMNIAEGGEGSAVAAMVNVPLGQSAALRAVGQQRRSPGYVDDLNQGLADIGEVDQSGVRVLGSWLPTDRLRVGALFANQRTGVEGVGVADQRERLENSSFNFVPSQKNRTALGNLVAAYDSGWGEFFSSSSYSEKVYNSVDSSDRKAGAGTEDQPNPVLTTFGDGDADSFAQEFRLLSPAGAGPWTWLAGVAGFRNAQYLSGRQPAPLRTSDQPLLDLPSIGTPRGTISSQTLDVLDFVFDAVGEEAAVFGEVSRKFGERWEVLAGGRWFRTEMVVDTKLIGALVVVLTEGQFEHRQHETLKESGFNPKLSVRYTLTDQVDLYALAAKGFQFGGVQIIPPSTGFESISEGVGFKPYKSSNLWNYEIGARSEWWGRRLAFDATLFYMDWKDLQLDRVVEAAPGQTAYVIIDNVGRAVSQGAEMALRLTPVQGLSWISTASFVEADSRAIFETSSGNVEPGTQLPGSSRFQMANSLSYELPFSWLGGWSAGLSLSHSHTGRIFNDLFHSAEYGRYDLFDAGLRLASTRFRLQPELSLTISNLTDVRSVAGIETCDGCDYQDIFLVQPRTALLSLTCTF